MRATKNGRSDPGQMTPRGAMSPPSGGFSQVPQLPGVNSAIIAQMPNLQPGKRAVGLPYTSFGGFDLDAAAPSSRSIPTLPSGEASKNFGPIHPPLQNHSGASLGGRKATKVTQRSVKRCKTGSSWAQNATEEDISYSTKASEAKTSRHSAVVISDDIAIPSSRANLQSACRIAFHPEQFITRDKAINQDIPQQSIETTNEQAIRTRKRRVIHDPEDQGFEPTDTTSQRCAVVVTADSRSTRGIRENNRCCLVTQHEYTVPDQLQSTREIMGQTCWTRYVQLTESLIDREICEVELNREERNLFHVQSERLRSKIRRMMYEMVAGARFRGGRK